MDAFRTAQQYRHQGIKKVDGWIHGIGNKHMRIALQHKFSFEQNPVLAVQLLKTWEHNYHILIEDSPRRPILGGS